MSIHLTIKNENCSNPRTATPKKKGLGWCEKPCEKGSLKQTSSRFKKKTCNKVSYFSFLEKTAKQNDPYS